MKFVVRLTFDCGLQADATLNTITPKFATLCSQKFPSKYPNLAKFGEVGNLLGRGQYCEYKLQIDYFPIEEDML